MATTVFAERRTRVAQELAAYDVDALLITHLVHVRYLSNFSGSNAGLLLHADGTATIATDGRYTTQVSEQAPDLPVIDARDCGPSLLKSLQEPNARPCRRIGIEAAHVTIADRERIAQVLDPNVELVPLVNVVERTRRYKDETEKQALRDIAALASQAYEELLAAGELRVGRTERHVAADLEHRMRLLGSEKVSFDTIVASGPQSAKPHHSPNDRVIEVGDIVTIDFGAHRDGYNSDMTRTVIMGKADDFSREIYDIVLEAEQAGVKAAVAGAELRDIDNVCRTIISDAGYAKYFVHSTGHGVGMDVHEEPYASMKSTGVLEADMTLTIEPGIYVPGKGGVRIEDTLIIGQNGPEIITSVDKALQVI